MKNSVKDTVQRRKRQIIGCVKMFAKHISEKLFVSEYKKDSQNSIVRKQAIQLKMKNRCRHIYQRKYMDSK